MARDSFGALYRKLNREQKKAVDAIEGPVMVVAGPGTGKTQVLILRIAKILRETDTAPSSILALTFTEAAASSMRRRLIEVIGAPAYRVRFSTFHGFCNEVIQRFPEAFPRIVGSKAITGVFQARVMESLIGALSLERLRPFGNPFYYLKPLLSLVNELKREGIGVEEFRRHVEGVKTSTVSRETVSGAVERADGAEAPEQSSPAARYAEAALVYEAYENELRARRLYDYNDMIVETLRALSEDADLLRALQEQYQYFLVDEHQDTNNAQNKVLALLANFHNSPNVFAVGDERQAIFRFQGASLENFYYFKKLYPDALLVTLAKNYRSGQRILDAADSILPHPAKLSATGAEAGEGIYVARLATPADEADFAAARAEERVLGGTPPSEIAIFCRENRDAAIVARALEKRGVPFFSETERNVFDDPRIARFIELLRAVNEYGNDERLVPLFHCEFLDCVPLDVYTILSHARKERAPLFRLIGDAAALRALSLSAPERFLFLAGLLDRLVRSSRRDSLIELVERALTESGLLESLIADPRSAETMEIFRNFFDEVQALSDAEPNLSLSSLLAHIDALAAHGIAVKGAFPYVPSGAVRLMTAHGAKGLEFEHVHIVGAHDGHWGNRRRRGLLDIPRDLLSLSGRPLGSYDENDDERRLFYVALTRARKSVTISYAAASPDGRERLPSQFVTELRPDAAQLLEVEAGARDGERDFRRAFSPAAPRPFTLGEREFVEQKFMEQGLSVTALNNYLRCPWEYFYVNLIQIPKAKARHQMFGTAVHGALKDFFGGPVPAEFRKDVLLERFEHHLRRERMGESDFRETLAKGRRSLEKYFDRYDGAWPRPTHTELRFSGIRLSPSIVLGGIIDRVDLFDGSAELAAAGAVKVVDYKTGRAKTRGEVEGTTANSTGELKRQLVFYKLLLELSGGASGIAQVGEIDFVEPDAKGKFRREQFELSADDVGELRGLIERVAGEILTLAFWDRRCDDPKCAYCALREAMGES